jgi:hypothetical protein
MSNKKHCIFILIAIIYNILQHKNQNIKFSKFLKSIDKFYWYKKDRQNNNSISWTEEMLSHHIWWSHQNFILAINVDDSIHVWACEILNFEHVIFIEKYII